MIDLISMGRKARAAAARLAQVSSEQKTQALLVVADCLWERRAEILAANQQDIHLGEAAGLTAALLDRLLLNEKRLQGIITDLRTVAHLPDPVGQSFDAQTLPNGLRIHKQRVPLGVLGVIYEARPNVTVDVTGIALRSGNAAILRGGKETVYSNLALVAAIQAGLAQAGIPAEAIQFIDDPDRAIVGQFLQMYEYVDMLIPRGGAGLHKLCRENSRIPVITGGIGICHLFVDDTADLQPALEVIFNAKVQRPSVCNALDTVLVHQAVAETCLPRIVGRLQTAGVTFRAHESAQPYLTGFAADVVQPAGAEDFDTEWLALILGLKVVSGIEEAIAHIAQHSTQHSDGILTADPAQAARFISEVDSSVVYVNSSTRFTDGAELGLGAEVAVSTQRLHARGPMALAALTTYKWVVQGDYHVRR